MPWLARRGWPLAVGGVFAAAAAWLALGYSGRIRDWGVMTDELQYVKLSLSIADGWSPLPRLHGQLVGSLNQLYPLLLAPVFGSLDAPAAFRAAHYLNAPLMASAAIPAYLLARELVDRSAALAVALLSVVVVWMTLTGFLLTEVVAYPAFLWAALAIQRAVTEPSTRRDLLALAGIALAILARTQFLVLLAVLPLAVVWHELFTRGWGARGEALRAVARHRLLVVAYALALVALAAAALAGSASSVLGDYSVTATQGSLLPSGIVRSAAAHLDSLAIGCGLLPLVLGGGWALTSLVRPLTPAAHAFATVTVATTILLALESASFDIRFGGRDVVRDRYVFYLAPLLLAGTAALLRERRRPWIAPVAVAVGFAATVHWLDLPPAQGLWVDSPTRVLNDLLAEQAGSLGVHAFVAWTGLLVGVCAVLALRFAPRVVVAPALFSLLLAFSLFTTLRAIDHTLASTSISGRGMSKDPGLVLDWVDTVVPPGAEVAIVPFPNAPSFAADADLWWDTEFWNATVSRAYVDGRGDFRYTPFPTRSLLPDWRTGVIPGTADASPYVVMAAQDPRFRLVADRVGVNYGLEILVPKRPYRVAWATRGLDPDGWARPGRTARLRLYASPRTPLRVDVQLKAPAEAAAPFALRARGRSVTGVAPKGSTETAGLRVCADAAGHADLRLLSRGGGVRVAAVQRTFAPVGTRVVGVGLAAVATGPGTGSC